MAYCGECEHWTLKPAADGMKTSDVGICDISRVEMGNMRHGCIMFTQRRKLEESNLTPIEKYKLAQAKANEKK